MTALGMPFPLQRERSNGVPTPKEGAEARGLAIINQDLITAKGAYSIGQVARLLGISRAAVSELTREQAILAVPGPDSDELFPVFQFTEAGIQPGLRAVLTTLPERDPWVRLNWLINPDELLGNETPFDLVKRGALELVLKAARGFGTMGA